MEAVVIDAIFEVYLDREHIRAYFKGYEHSPISPSPEAIKWRDTDEAVFFWKEVRLPPLQFPLTRISLELLNDSDGAEFEVKEVTWFEKKQKLLIRLEEVPTWDLVGPEDFDLTIWKVGEYTESKEFAAS